MKEEIKKCLMLSLLVISILPAISADIITPGYHGISIVNTITNINDFPDYVFVAYGKAGDQPCMLGGTQVQIITSDGKIESVYKMCSVSVYAIKKSDFNESQLIIDVKSYDKDYENYQKLIFDFLNSPKAKEVIKNIYTYDEIPDSSTVEGISNYYEINLDDTLTAPTDKTVIRNNLFYLYIIIPIIALLIIIAIIIKRKR
jgi:hypothetical protein